jgi:hypothetical protein
MQYNPLLEQLDWCFTTLAWTSTYPSTLMLPLAKTLSDHTPCYVQIGTSIPKAQIFRVENHWFHQPGFMELVEQSWSSQVQATNSATRIAAKFKALRRILKNWSKSISKLGNLIKTCNDAILLLDKLEEQRRLSIPESNCRGIIKEQVKKLLRCKNEYWRQRFTIRWVQLGDEPIRFFHAAATKRYRKNTISILQDEDGRDITLHSEKAASLWNTFKTRMGATNSPTICFDLDDFNFPCHNLEHLVEPFTTSEIDQVVKLMPMDKSPGLDGFNARFLKKMLAYYKGLLPTLSGLL